jgi:AcrR family transcriptional regulator
MSPRVRAAASTPRLGSRSASTRAAILDAALAEFGAHGFDGASLQPIAARAGVHAPLISYHFGDKLGLWQAAVDHLFADLDRRLEVVAAQPDAELALRTLIRVFVRFAAAHPELNRIIVCESAAGTERLRWLVETHSRRRYEDLVALVRPLQRRGVVRAIPPLSLYYLIAGGASLPFVAAPEAEQLSGRDPASPAFIAAHAAALEALLFT